MSTATIHTLTPRNAPVASTPPPRRIAPLGVLTYTVAEVASMLSLNLGGTYRMIRSGDIPARKLGGRWVIPRRAFHDWLESCRQPAPADTAADRRAAIGDLTDDEIALIRLHRDHQKSNRP